MEKILKDKIINITKTIGFGYPENVYQKALDYELRKEGYFVQLEYNIDIVYKGVNCGSIRADMIVNNGHSHFNFKDAIIIELKCVDKIKPKQRSQLQRYLKTTGLKQGFLINISYDSYEIEEMFNK